MANIDTIKGALVQILVGDGATPEVFDHRCMINTSRGIQWSSTTSQNPVPDCDNPEDPAWLETEVDGLVCTIDGAGRVDVADVEFWDDWFISGAAKNVRFKLNKTGGSYWEGAFKLTQWGISAADRQEKAEGAITLVSTGAVTRADA